MKKLWKQLEPIHGTLYFAIILLCSNCLWKLVIAGDESDNMVTFLGMDISAPFVRMTHWIADSVAYLLNNWLHAPIHVHGTALHYVGGSGVVIVWSCTAVKQMYIFCCIIAFYSGAWKNKLWYIPLGLGLIYLFNILRITLIVYVIKDHPEYLDFLHQHLLKYLFYGFIFLLWVVWAEKFSQKKSPKPES